MKNMDALAKAVAAAIKENSGGRITQKQSGGMIATLASKVKPDELAETIAPLTNISQFNQELERFGLVKTERAMPAYIAAIAAELKK